MKGLLTQETADGDRGSALAWKDTPIGRVPADWEVLPIAELLEMTFPGEWGIEPSGHGGDVLVLRSTNIDDDGSIDYSTAAPRYLSPSKVTGKRLQTGDVLLESSGGGPAKPVGRVALFVQPADGRSYVCSNFFRTLRPRRSKVHPAFLFWRLLSLYREPRIWRYQQQTTGIINLTLREYVMALVAVPERSEQERISKALEKVNAAVEVSRALVKKYQRVHAGLIETLLTCGIDNEGRVRNRASHVFKLTELGWMPELWNARPFGHAIVFGPQNGLYKPASAYLEGDGGSPIVRIDGFHRGEPLDVTRLKRLTVTNQDLNLFGLRVGDLLINRVNSIEFVGKSALVSRLVEPTVFESNIMRVRLASDRMIPEFGLLLLTSDEVAQQIRQRAKSAVAQASINQADVRSVLVRVPPFNEQLRIVEAVDQSRAVLTALQRELEKFMRLKSGLIQALLSGRVRIPPGAAGL